MIPPDKFQKIINDKQTMMDIGTSRLFYMLVLRYLGENRVENGNNWWATNCRIMASHLEKDLEDLYDDRS